MTIKLLLTNKRKIYIDNITCVQRIQNKASCVSIVLVTLMHCLFVKHPYAAIALKRLTIKLSKLLCLELYAGILFLDRNASDTVFRVMEIIMISDYEMVDVRDMSALL